jgi:hypothetical protein
LACFLLKKSNSSGEWAVLQERAALGMTQLAIRAVNQLIDYQLIAILIDYFNYQFNYLKPTSISISNSSCHWRPIELSTN